VIFVVIAVALVAPAAYGVANGPTGKNAAAATAPKHLNGGRTLYKKFCGQCHALKEAKAVGLGEADKKGLGELGGPSFNPLRVTALQCKLAITGVWDGHAKVMTRMTHAQINLVSKWVEAVTRDHPFKATMPSDFFR
jgi:mono/diheme cytochrome c family protein